MIRMKILNNIVIGFRYVMTFAVVLFFFISAYSQQDPGAGQIFYQTGDGATETAAQSFTDFFPDVPEKAIKPGYTWSSTDTLTNKSSVMTLIMVINAENKFEGYENFNGINCAKITYTLSGTRDLKTQSQGMDKKMVGPFSGSGELLFAPVEGYFMKHSVKTKMPGTLEITSPESMSFPVVMYMDSSTEVRK
jgi:hypothetical protein